VEALAFDLSRRVASRRRVRLVMLVVGLGNPGPRYATHRHNVGFMVVDRLFASASTAGGGPSFREQRGARWAKVRVSSAREVILLEPLDYMNRSGEPVEAAMRFFEIAIEDVLVIHDELDLPFGTLRLKRGGGAGGHNGLRSIIERVGPDFGRLRIGIGRPQEGPIEAHVLGNFDDSEGAELPGVLHDATRAVEAVVSEGLSAAMNAFNVRKK
jgi:PTH1 family peptidyl-tRNA hydrolase